jgi:REP-associated tyrosine transposase
MRACDLNFTYHRRRPARFREAFGVRTRLRVAFEKFPETRGFRQRQGRDKTFMRESWPHAPPHYFTPGGTYIITAAAMHRKPLFDSGAKLDLLRDTMFDLAKNYALILQARAFFPNHYHLVISFEQATIAHHNFVRHLHRELATRLNRADGTLGRRVMYEFWDTRLSFEKSWLARLNYVHQNAVKHGSVPAANQYPWCSASWFETNARSGFVKSVYSFKTDRVNVPDDF